MYDLINHKSTALPFENRKNIRRIAVSPDGRMLISIDIEGNSIFFNMARRLVLLHFNFKRKVYDIAFSPDSTMFAITFGRGCQIWRCPNTKLEFCPLTLLLNTSGLNDDVICLDWSTDSNSIMMGSKDLTARIYTNVKSKKLRMTALTGHRDKILNVFFSQEGTSAFTVARNGAVITYDFSAATEEKTDNEDNAGNTCQVSMPGTSPISPSFPRFMYHAALIRYAPFNNVDIDS